MVREDIVKLAKRENNNKRKYLIVNPLQGKHVPVKPESAFELFDALAEQIKDEYKDEKLLLVGFAETATAIGAALAVNLNAKYIQTTREVIPNVEYLFFSETHSHATEQKLVKDDLDEMVGKVDRIVFIEDEVTTGNTILGILNILENLYSDDFKFSVASLLNGMDAEALNTYKKRNVNVHYLIKTDHSEYSDRVEKYVDSGAYIEPAIANAEGLYNAFNVSGWMDSRRLVEASEYNLACKKLWQDIENRLSIHQSTLVIGTEEFMYPALYVGSCIESKGLAVKCHSTTRSPIAVFVEEGYPLNVRYELSSLYDSNRRTFIYDIGKYDQVLIITDTQSEEHKGIHTLVNAIKRAGNSNINLVRWCK